MTDAPLAPEYLIRRIGDAHPFGDTAWTLEQARQAADYNRERWGSDQWEVVTRQVTPYTVVPEQTQEHITASPRRVTDSTTVGYLRGLRDARAAVAVTDRYAAASPMMSAEIRAALAAIDKLVAAASTPAEDTP